jgi:hypothetical protein
MRCQYSRCDEVSSEKHVTAADRRAEAESWLMSVVTVTVVAGGYRAVPESLTAMTCRAKSATALRFRMCGRLSSYETLLERLAQDLEPMTATLGQFIQEGDAVVGQRHFARHRHMAPADPPDIRTVSHVRVRPCCAMCSSMSR